MVGSCKRGMYIHLQSVVLNFPVSSRTVSVLTRILIHGLRQQEDTTLHLRGILWGLCSTVDTNILILCPWQWCGCHKNVNLSRKISLNYLSCWLCQKTICLQFNLITVLQEFAECRFRVFRTRYEDGEITLSLSLQTWRKTYLYAKDLC